MGLRPVAGAYHKDEKKGPELHARVSQETFDEAVQENIDTFDMEPEEALADAVSQFESQGINLSNIVKRVPGADAADDPPAVVALRELKNALEAAAEAYARYIGAEAAAAQQAEEEGYQAAAVLVATDQLSEAA